jgi:hypothetical protein
VRHTVLYSSCKDISILRRVSMHFTGLKDLHEIHCFFSHEIIRCRVYVASRQSEAHAICGQNNNNNNSSVLWYREVFDV